MTIKVRAGGGPRRPVIRLLAARVPPLRARACAPAPALPPPPALRRGLRLARVRIDVLLSRQLQDRVHDLVGDGAQREALVVHPGVAREVQWLPEADGDPDRARQPAPGRLCFEGADHRARHHRHPRLDRHRGDAGTPLVEPAVVRAGALRVDPQQPPLAQHRQPRRDRRLRGAATGPVHRDLPDTAEERRGQPALQPGAGEVLGLGQKGHPARHDRRHHEMVGERQMIAGDDRRAVFRHVLDALDPRPEHQPQQGPEDHVFEYLVEHRFGLPVVSVPTQSSRPPISARGVRTGDLAAWPLARGRRAGWRSASRVDQAGLAGSGTRSPRLTGAGPPPRGHPSAALRAGSPRHLAAARTRARSLIRPGPNERPQPRASALALTEPSRRRPCPRAADTASPAPPRPPP